MHSKSALIALLIVVVMATTHLAPAQTPVGSAHTYQGRLLSGGTPVDQMVDIRFTICDSEMDDCSGGATVIFDGQAGNGDPVEVVNGIFTVDLDFGVEIFDGDARWLKILVRPHDPLNSSLYAVLSPRQPITPTPYALQTRGMFVNDTENVGVGNKSPQCLLQVGEDDESELRIGANPQLVLRRDVTDNKFRIQVTGNNFTGNVLQIGRDDQNHDIAMMGNVGIGTTTPGGALEVVGPVRSRDAGAGFFAFNPNNPNASAHFSWLNDTARIRVGGSGPGANGGFSIQRIGDETLFRVTDNRRVGIVEENPLARLHVTGESIGLLAGALENDEFVVEAQDAVMGLYSTSQGTWGSAITLKEVSGGNIVDTWGIARTTSPSGSNLSFTYGPSENYADNPGVATFGSDGNVGIGTTSPASRLTVLETGGIDPALRVTQSGSGLAIDATHTVGNNGCAKFEITNSNGAATTMIANTSGTGGAASFTQSNSGVTAPTVTINANTTSANHFNLSVVSNGNGSAGNFFCNDTSGGGHGVIARVRGAGNAADLTAEGTGVALEANHNSTTANVVRFERTADSGANADLLELRSGAGSDNNMQFIECERGGDFEFRVWGDGDVTADGAFTGGGADFAEMIRVTSGADSVEPGDVMVIDATASRAVVRSSGARSTLVAGIYSTKPGLIGSENDWDQIAADLDESNHAPGIEVQARKPIELGRMIDEIPLAIVGIVPCKVSTENGVIRPGDLLVTSSIPGHAMRDDNARAGTIVGKALGSLNEGTGVIRVLVTLQ